MNDFLLSTKGMEVEDSNLFQVKHRTSHMLSSRHRIAGF